MEKTRENESKCFICDQGILNGGYDIFCNYTTFSVTLISKILERFIGHELTEPSKACLICCRCLDKIHKYDYAFVTAEQVQKELTELLLKTENYYSTIGEIEESDTDTIQIIGDGGAYIIKEEYEYHDKLSGKDEDVNQYDVHLFTSSSKESENSTESKIEYVERLEEESSEEYTSIEESVLVEVVAASSSPSQEGKLEESLEGNTKHNTSKRNTTCNACGVKFSNSKELREHWKQNHDTGDRVACDLCGMTYKSQAALNIHLGMHKGISPFKCDVCGKKFTQKGALKRHKPIHTGERPYQCEKCGKRFVHYSSFHMHTLAHDDVRDKKCDICGLLLRSTSHLNRHKLVHSGLKPHACPVCDQRFAQRYNMMTHLRSHQGIQRKRKHVCAACNRGFTSDNLLRAHVERAECLPLKNNKIISNNSDDPIIMYEELITPDS